MWVVLLLLQIASKTNFNNDLCTQSISLCKFFYQSKITDSKVRVHLYLPSFSYGIKINIYSAKTSLIAYNILIINISCKINFKVVTENIVHKCLHHLIENSMYVIHVELHKDLLRFWNINQLWHKFYNIHILASLKIFLTCCHCKWSINTCSHSLNVTLWLNSVSAGTHTHTHKTFRYIVIYVPQENTHFYAREHAGIWFLLCKTICRLLGLIHASTKLPLIYYDILNIFKVLCMSKNTHYIVPIIGIQRNLWCYFIAKNGERISFCSR